ncbi:hypothetical protein MNBD_GAMMA09-1362 [hydrothermal vent metagenome]|uniref:SpoVT-AbrB domain-containing protein n=1 Tax=hydrothermal vent metagenome TaxID=652676 RepID=A0A3B0X7F7_9ZZZZ
MKSTLQKSEPRIAKLFQNGGSQAVRLPKEYRFDADSVEIIREGEKLIISPVKAHRSWKEYFSTPSLVEGNDDFMDAIKDLPPLPDESVFDD